MSSDGDDKKLYPTHSCFDDAVEFLEDVAKTAPSTLDEYTLVHALCLFPGTGVPYAHAWVEHGELAWQSGILRRKRVTYAVRHPELRAELRPFLEKRYSPEQVYLENRRTRHVGPWEPAIAACVRNPRAGTVPRGTSEKSPLRSDL